MNELKKEKIITLARIADELENNIIDLNKAIFMLTPKVCPICQKFYTDDKNIEAIFDMGECLACDHIDTDWADEEK